MDDLAERIERAKQDDRELELLVSDYLPFIKKETGKFGAATLEYDDRLSLGMLVFVNCVRQYSSQRGGFLSYASVCIRNRLISEARRLGGEKTIYFSDNEERQAAALEEKAALETYSQQQEQRELQAEIASLAGRLAAYGLSFMELPRICPKQKRSRTLCANLARRVLQDAGMLASFNQRGQLPQKELAAQAGISQKTVEKHRRYIVALLVILQGDYPGIGAYIPGYREVE